MTDIFFSYSSADRERVRPIRDALAEQGFEVFWDQQVPAGMDWDTWIRQHLTKSKCAMAFWSATSVSSDNVRHEATVAKQQGKLISVLLEPLTAEQFPMGLYAQQAANLSGWSGDYSHDEWRKFRREFEAKLTPLWVRRQIDEIEAELVGERTRREGAERRDRTMQGQIAKEVEVQQILKRERDDALDEVAALKGTVEKLTQARADATAKQADAQQALKRERDNALDEVAAIKGTVEELTQAREHAEARTVELSQRLRKVRQSKAQEIAGSIGAAFSPFVIAAALATLGFWTYQLIWSAPQPLLAVTSDSTADAETKLKAAEIEQQRLQEEVQGQAKAATDAETRLQAAQAEQQRQARAATDADTKRRAAEAEQQRLKDEVQRQTKTASDAETKLQAAQAEQQRQARAATDADTKRRAAEAEQQRLKDEVQRQTKAAADADAKRRTAEAEQQRLAAALSQSTPAATNRLFDIRRNMEAKPKALLGSYLGLLTVRSMDECEQKCAQSESCNAFSLYNKTSWTELQCYLYRDAELAPNSDFDSGVRK
jgi:chromosome segregation ATPase